MVAQPLRWEIPKIVPQRVVSAENFAPSTKTASRVLNRHGKVEIGPRQRIGQQDGCLVEARLPRAPCSRKRHETLSFAVDPGDSGEQHVLVASDRASLHESVAAISIRFKPVEPENGLASVCADVRQERRHLQRSVLWRSCSGSNAQRSHHRIGTKNRSRPVADARRPDVSRYSPVGCQQEVVLCVERHEPVCVGQRNRSGRVGIRLADSSLGKRSRR
ncbi:MAG: hypothetical protein KatS3mg105_4431 [Gemmatales bacterium]|nr:MAG: hypothetical protein KatS3mg105_4431 [Gemmatales bacterium]